MEWTTCIKCTIEYMEENLLEVIGPNDIADHIGISTMYLQRGFQILTGYTLGEYLRYRRLYEAGMELKRGEKVIDMAFKYGYDTPESFTKAFQRFHSLTPLEAKKNTGALKPFHPIHIRIEIKGGSHMDYVVEKMEEFQVIGLVKDMDFETSYQDIPKFWDEVYTTFHSRLYQGAAPTSKLEEAILKHKIGEFGICIGDESNAKTFRYMIGGKYQGGEVPEGLEVVGFPAQEWVRFKCIGPLPESLQQVNTQIFREWLPGNKEFEISGTWNVEWYSSEKNMQDPSYHSEIWIPVKRK